MQFKGKLYYNKEIILWLTCFLCHSLMVTVYILSYMFFSSHPALQILLIVKILIM